MFRFVVLIALVALAVSCDSKDTTPTPTAVESTSPIRTKASGQGSDEAADSAEEHDHGDEHFHLGGKMNEISRRFSAIWFAGQSGNAAMVKYQTHELEEVIEEIDEAKPTEAGVDIASRLQKDVEAHFEDLETAADSKDQKAFEATYRKVMNNCTTCHADTKHGFIQVKLPEYNPYPNLAY